MTQPKETAMTDQPLDLEAIMRQHGNPNMSYRCWCQFICGGQWPCDTYCLAAELAAEREQQRRVREEAWNEGQRAGWDECSNRWAEGDTASHWWEAETVNPYRQANPA